MSAPPSTSWLIPPHRLLRSCVVACCLWLALMVSAAQAAEPPYAGTVYIDPDIITSSDPTTFQSLTDAGRGFHTIPNRVAYFDGLALDMHPYDAMPPCLPNGDVDQNASVTAADALLAFQQALGLTQLTACQSIIADVFPRPAAPDGSITAADALCIFQKALGLPSCLDTLPSSPEIDVAQFLAGPVEQGESPGLFAAVMDEGGIRAAAAAGVRRQGSPEELTVNDLIHVGSNTKAMTATMLAVLVEDNVFPHGWETTIADVFPELLDQIHSDYHAVDLFPT